jgi:hypothetical protein
MKTHTTNYKDTFIAVADDCPAKEGEIPPQKGENQSVANIQFDMIIRHPYQYTSDDVLFQVYAQRNNIPESDYKKAREAFFSKGQPCFRASPLTKRYGWGLHADENEKIALYPLGSEEYRKLMQDKRLKVVKAMKTSR